MEKEKKRRSFSDNLLWILFLMTALYLFLSSFAMAAMYGLIRLLEMLWDTSPAVIVNDINKFTLK